MMTRFFVLLFFTMLGASGSALAASEPATPGFDRPGLLFATDTIPEGYFAYEQGLPDMSFSETAGTDASVYALNAALRYGFAQDWEVQLGLAPLAHVRIDGPVNEVSETGYGDLRLGVKHSLPAAFGDKLGGADVGFLGGITLPTGDDAFTADGEILDLGLTATWAMNAPGRSVGVLAQLTTGSVADDLLIAAAYNAPLGTSAGYYLEAGITSGDSDGSVLGGGAAWSPWRDFQLDAYVLGGVSGDAPDLQAGFGVSIFFR